ncbi:hypothetical protein [Reyranella soli]|uniref:Mobilization protein n=1 Tax=Reyranella soli TaxID=1230389 RepID=A0A512NNC8_9HYPH|nr:hypothetical protein [Reyranella soli]GEP60432.1 hypothetical protein RSO01_75980 [Reyranella soli]
MARQSGREPPISYRPPQALREEFRARVEKSGLTAGAFITQSVFGGPAPRQSRRPAVEHRTVARLLAETAQVNAQLQTLAAGGHDPAALESAVRELREIRAACLEALGRSP